MYILALNGSHNKNGNTQFLLEEILKNFKKEDTEIINIHDAIKSAKQPFCTNCTTPCQRVCYEGTMLEDVYNKVTKADFVIIGSPVYFGSMSAQTKAFFDKTRYIRGEKLWLGKPMAAVSCGASKYGGQERCVDHIHSSALVLGMKIVGNGSDIGMGHFGVSAEKPACEDKFAINQCKSLAEAIKNEIKYE